MGREIEDLKRVSLVEFLSDVYGMEFERVGGEYRALSPFTDERTPSFFVREVDGAWLFKDFSSGEGGSIIDVVRIMEQLPDEIPLIIDKIHELRGTSGARSTPTPQLGSSKASSESESKRMSVEQVHEAIAGNDLAPVRSYLRQRAIATEVIDELENRELLLHNRHRDVSWVCFAVRDLEGELRCLVNEQLDGPDKFIYGSKYPFSIDAKHLSEAETVYVTEGVMDYLSLRTLLGDDCAGLALLGNDPGVVEPEMIANAKVIHAAMDHDEGGLMGLLDFPVTFEDCEIEPLMFDDIKDPAKLLLKLRDKGERIPVEAKIWLYQKAQHAENKAELARRWGIDRSHLYELLRHGDEALAERFKRDRRGRKPKDEPRTLEEALQRIEQLEAEKQQLEVAREEEQIVNAFTKLQLKWAEEDLRETGVRPKEGKKRQLKKRKKSKP